MDDPPDYDMFATTPRRSSRLKTTRDPEASRAGGRGAKHGTIPPIGNGKPHAPANAIPSIIREIAALKERVGEEYQYPTTKAPTGRQRNPTTLPEMFGLSPVLGFMREANDLVTAHTVLEFLRSDGVLPQLSMWHKECSKNSGQLRGQLEEKLSPATDAAAQELALHISRLTGLSRERMYAEETCEAVRVCVEYTKSLRSKNLDTFRGFNIPDAHIPIICSSILIAAHRDFTEDQDDGFFATLFGSRLANPMIAKTRGRWELVYLMPKMDGAEKDADAMRTLKQILGVILSAEPKPDIVHNAAPQLNAAHNAAPIARVVPSASRRVIVKSSGEKKVDFKRQYALWREETEKLDAKKAAMQDTAAAELEDDQFGDQQTEPPERMIKTVPDLARFIPLEYGRTGARPITPGQGAALLGTFNYTPSIDANPFTDMEELLYLEAFLIYKKGPKPSDGRRSNIGFIAEIMPRRTPAECIQHHYARKGRRAYGNGTTGEKRPAGEFGEEAPLRKIRKAVTGADELALPDYSTAAVGRPTHEKTTLLLNRPRIIERIEGLELQLAVKDRDLQEALGTVTRLTGKAHKHNTAGVTKGISQQTEKQPSDELPASFREQLAAKDAALQQQESLHAAEVRVLKAEKDTALQQMKQFHEEELNELRDSMRTDFDKELAKKDTELQQQKDRYTLEISGFQAKLLKQAGGFYDVPSSTLEAAGHHTVDNEEPAKGDHVLQQEKVLYRKTITKLAEIVSLRDLKLAKIGVDADELLDNGNDHFFDEAYRLRALVEDMTEKAAKANKEINEAWSKCEEYGKDAEKARETRDAAVEQKDLAESKLHDLKQDIQTTFDNQARRIADIDNKKSPENMTLAEEAYKSLKESIWIAESKQAGRIEALAKGQGPKELTFAESAIKNLYKRVQQLKDVMRERNVPIPPSRK